MGARVEYTKEIVLQRLIHLSKIDYESGCYLFSGSKNKRGYGQLTLGRGNIKNVHRLSAWIFYDLDLNSAMQANHKAHCSNKNCWAPSHIYVGTAKENKKDFTDTITHCPRGHEYTFENTAYSTGFIKDRNGNYFYTKMRYCKECKRIGTALRRSK